MISLSLIYTTLPNTKSAKHLTRTLVREKLAACVVVFPAESTYIWNKRLTHTKECVVFCKTTKNLAKKLITRIEQLHPYDIPCIIHTTLSANRAYIAWMNDVLK